MERHTSNESKDLTMCDLDKFETAEKMTVLDMAINGLDGNIKIMRSAIAKVEAFTDGAELC